MHHKIIALVCAAAVIAAGIASVVQYNHVHEARLSAAHQSALIEQAAANHKASIDAADKQVATQHAQAECRKELSYYNLLTTRQKNTVQAPACTVAE